MSLNLVFVAVFATIGLIVSLIGGFIVGNRLTYISFVSLLSTLCFGGMGFAIYKILERRVPEFLNFLQGIAGIVGEGYSSDSDLNEFSNLDSDSNSQMEESSSAYDGYSEINQSIHSPGSKSGKFGDHLMVDKIAIKNEPKLMAEAIRTMISRDNE